MRNLLLTLLIGCVAAHANTQPNIIFFFSDDQAYDTLGCYGNPDVKTPNVDKLAARGVAFDRHYNTTAICKASRANVMTGLLEYKNGTNFDHGPMIEDIWQQSYPVLLRKAGYRTAFGGKFGFGVVADATSKGSDGSYEHLPMDDFDFWVGGTGQTNYKTAANKYLAKYADKYPHSSRAYGAAGQDFIKESVAAKKPFALTLFFKAPHRPTTPDPMFDDVYKDTTFRKLPNYGRKAGEHMAKQSRMGRQYPRFEEWGYHTDASYQKAMRTYHQQIYGVDYAVGMVMEELERQGVADNTIVIFSSDNGFFNGSHGLGSKVLPYEEGARVPLVIADPRAPKSAQGTRTAAISGNIDITATILDAAGVKAPANMDGVSLMPLVNKKANAVRDTLPLIQVWGSAGTFSLTVVTEKHKYVYWPYAEGMSATEELFDMKKDPLELKTFTANPEYGGVLDNMRKLYDAELTKWKQKPLPTTTTSPSAPSLIARSHGPIKKRLAWVKLPKRVTAPRSKNKEKRRFVTDFASARKR